MSPSPGHSPLPHSQVLGISLQSSQFPGLYLCLHNSSIHNSKQLANKVTEYEVHNVNLKF